MRRILVVGCLVLAGCETGELTNGGARVLPIDDAPAGCRLIGTLRDKEGGGLRSFAENRWLLETRLRNEAARLGGNSMSVVSEKRGDTDEGQLDFASGVAGLSTPASRCSNCVLVTARVFACEGRAPAVTRPVPVAPGECAPPAARPAPAPEDADADD
jgi:hypothetical protein